MYNLYFKDIQILLKKEKLLREIIQGEQWHASLNDSHILNSTFSKLSFDSKNVDSDTLFFCKGKEFKEKYLEEAIQKGSRFYVSETIYEQKNVTGLIVSDVRKAMAVIAREFYQWPQNKLKLIGVTGTKGKTTTAYLLKDILQYTTNHKTALLSSIEISVDGKNFVDAHLTTPESLDLYRMMAEAVENGMSHLIMEVSSQAYKLHRVYGLHFDVGFFLNISPDHIGPLEHPSFEDYFYCKRQLLVNSDKVVLFAGTDYFTLLKEMTEDANQEVIVYGSNEPGSEYYFENDPDDTLSFSVKSTNEDVLQITGDYSFSMPGDFNKENALSAIIGSALVGATREECQQGIMEGKVPGRMEIFTQKNGSSVYVDYAHNYISLKRLLEFVKIEHSKGKVIVVLGSPGGKGISRRQDFGEVLSSYADVAILSSDDPNFEDPTKIAQEIARHITGNLHPMFIMDRTEAIDHALQLAGPEDSVVIAGKGDQKYQIVDGKWVPYEGDSVLVSRFINKE